MLISWIPHFFKPGTLITIHRVLKEAPQIYLVVDIDPWTKMIGLMNEFGRVETHTSTTLLYTIQHHRNSFRAISPEGIEQDLSIFYLGFAA